MNYYQVLQVSTKASQVDIDRAYQKLVKEARFDTNLNRKDIETAYRVLSNPTQKALYDAAIADQQKEATLKVKKIRKPMNMRQMGPILVGLLVIALCFYFYRYSYIFASFQPGDVLISRETGQYVGKVIGEQPMHSFAGVKKDAYFLDTPTGKVYIPMDQVKRTCKRK